MWELEGSTRSPHMSSKKSTYIVSFCILLSRIFGLLREILLAHVIGTSLFSDALRAALRIPNFLQNLLGEGVLSASFIPVYLSLDNKEERSNLATTLFYALLLITGITSFFGIIFPELFIDLFAPGFEGATRDLTISLLRILFPSAAILVLSAWCLGILNSHKIFFLSYSSPLAWNLSIILSLTYCLYAEVSVGEAIYIIACGFLLGSLLQFLIQVPKTLSFISLSKPNFRCNNFFKVVKNFIPVVLGRGAVQISSYVDTIIASFLPIGSLSVLMYAQTLYLLPISVFAMSISAVDLPSQSEKSFSSNKKDFYKALVESRDRALFFLVPSSFFIVLFGYDFIALVFQSNKFSSLDSLKVWLTLCAFTLGLIPVSISRIYSSSLYAQNKHKGVSLVAIFRLVFGTLLCLYFCFRLPGDIGISPEFAVIGLGLSSSIISIFELILLSRKFEDRLSLNNSQGIRIVLSGCIAMLLALSLIKFVGAQYHYIYGALLFILSYLVAAYFFRVKEIR